MENIDWTAILVASVNSLMPILVPVLIALLGTGVGVLINYFKLISAKIKSEKPDQWALADKIFTEVVKAAEQMKLGAYIDNKLDWATQEAQKQLDKAGITMSAEEIRIKIEKTVYDEFTKNGLGDTVLK